MEAQMGELEEMLRLGCCMGPGERYLMLYEGQPAITNRTGLRAARKKLIDTNFKAALLADFNRLPDNVATPAGLSAVAQLLKNPTKAERITSGWARFFREKYKRIAR